MQNSPRGWVFFFGGTGAGVRSRTKTNTSENRTLHVLSRLRDYVQLWRLSRALTGTMADAIRLWSVAISRTRFGVRRQDSVKQKLLVAVWATKVATDRSTRSGPRSFRCGNIKTILGSTGNSGGVFSERELAHSAASP